MVGEMMQDGEPDMDAPELPMREAMQGKMKEKAYGDAHHNLSRPVMSSPSMGQTQESLKLLGAGQPYNAGQ